MGCLRCMTDVSEWWVSELSELWSEMISIVLDA